MTTTADPSNAPKELFGNLYRGARVKHATFGSGLVVKVDSAFAFDVVTVKFHKAGQKQIQISRGSHWLVLE
ncbi:hypothetical protein L1047_06345 [Synechococcus sp. Nb3U1]|uniref:hypothetical protein n=1 Tax=Synechococcus sp. Nb3U1 TaxID=1914529 RepID=UPI001F481D27|nr:hypothetical protein [Synechococcus sp. Nb3U1]MCF2970816.1 hypothetical protein [Synechococcus sp. Nb3U1]